MIFPAGGVSTTPTVWHKRAIDTEWKNVYRAPHQPGEGARGAGLLRRTKQPPLPARESYQHDAAPLAHVQGSARPDRQRSACARGRRSMPFERLPAIGDRHAFMNELREMTYALGQGVPTPPKTRIKRPRSAQAETEHRFRAASVFYDPPRRPVRHLPRRSRAPASGFCGRETAGSGGLHG